MAETILVRYFASAAEAAGREDELVDVAALAPAPESPLVPTVGALRSLLISRYGEPMARVLASGSFLVDGVVSRDDARTLGARVDVLPPFAGG